MGMQMETHCIGQTFLDYYRSIGIRKGNTVMIGSRQRKVGSDESFYIE